MSIVPTGMIVSYLAKEPRSKAISGIMLSALAKIWNILCGDGSHFNLQGLHLSCHQCRLQHPTLPVGLCHMRRYIFKDKLQGWEEVTNLSDGFLFFHTFITYCICWHDVGCIAGQWTNRFPDFISAPYCVHTPMQKGSTLPAAWDIPIFRCSFCI